LRQRPRRFLGLGPRLHGRLDLFFLFLLLLRLLQSFSPPATPLPTHHSPDLRSHLTRARSLLGGVRFGAAAAAMPRTAAGVDVEDLLVRVKNGADAELAEVAREVAALAEQGRLGEDDDEDGVLVPALLARLAAAGGAEARVRVMAALRRLARCVGCESKVST
jgi:hypothetical protein